MKCPFCGKEVSPWSEEVLKAGAFHERKQIEKGKAKLYQGIKKGWSLRDSGKILKIPYNRMRNIVIIYEKMKKNPEIEKLESMEMALKVLGCQK